VEVTKLSIAGCDLESLAEILDEELVPDYVYSSEKFFVFIVENSDFLLDRSIPSTIVLDYNKKGKCVVEVVSIQGGNYMGGLLAGSEKKTTNKIVEYFRGVCSKKSWKLEIEE
jgi:hypothetical protein